ncbi:MAG: hypothetical protein RLZZ412_687 [Verrucomicrobiota bacterium]|jgi:hypothetical protein
MRLAARLLLACLLGFGLARAATDPKLLLIEQKLNGFTDEDYAGAVEKLLAEHETRTGLPLRPGSLRKCGLKISSESGVGLCTPKPLVRAVGAALLRRGFARDAVIICDGRQESMRACGFLPALSKDEARFEGYPAQAWDQLAPGWAGDARLRYENQVMPSPGTPNVPWGNPRISILPKTLFDDVDFWINLPVLSDSKSLGVHGALAAASLGNMVNAERFLDMPSNAAKAAIEVCAIPGLTRRQALTILSLERYQVLGGPTYDAGWVRSDKVLLASANPVILDFVGLQKINAGRAARQIARIHPEPPIFSLANDGEIRLGTCRPDEITLVRLPAP